MSPRLEIFLIFLFFLIHVKRIGEGNTLNKKVYSSSSSYIFCAGLEKSPIQQSCPAKVGFLGWQVTFPVH